jgi:hypothetical protein
VPSMTGGKEDELMAGMTQLPPGVGVVRDRFETLSRPLVPFLASAGGPIGR